MMIGEPNHHSHTYISTGLDNTTMVDHHNYHIASSPPSPSLGTHHRQLINPSATSFQLSSSPPSPLSKSINSSTLNGGDSSPTHAAVNPYLLTDYDAILSALSRYLPSNSKSNSADLIAAETHQDLDGSCPYTSANYDSDEFRMYDFKVRGCTRAKAHDWTECPFAHPGEKARRRDPRLYGYTGTACTDFRKGNCRRGDSCEFAHGVFECWLHPTRYRTQACKDGPNCTRRVCFFAHSPDELRVLSPRSIVTTGSGSGSGSGSDPFDDAAAGGLLVDSPPLTPLGRSFGSGSVNELLTRMRNLQLDKVKSMPAAAGSGGSSSWNPPLGSPPSSGIRTGGFYSLPTTPTTRIGMGVGFRDVWGEEVPERVLDSGRELRAQMFERLSKENPLADRIDSVNCGSGPDVGWVSDLLK